MNVAVFSELVWSRFLSLFSNIFQKQDPAPAIHRKNKRSDEKQVNNSDQTSQGTTNANRSSMESFDSLNTSKSKQYATVIFYHYMHSCSLNVLNQV